MADNNHVDLNHIPFVDGTPTVSEQSRIDWIQNGEFPDGAKSLYNNEGSLNRAGVKIQQNIATIDANTHTLKIALNQLKDLVQTHSNILGEGTDGIFERVADLETQILQLDELSQTDDNLQQQIDNIKADIGQVAGGVIRTIRSELWFLKGTIGNYPNFDSDGLPKTGENGRGLKGELQTTINTVNSQGKRIQKLEQDWQSSDVSELTERIAHIREEIGARSDAKTDNMYTRLDAVEIVSTQATQNITDLQSFVGTDSYPYISKLTGDVLTNIDELVMLLDNNTKLIYNDLLVSFQYTLYMWERMGDVNGETPNTIEFELKRNRESNDELREIIGDTDSEGLRKAVIDTQQLSNSTSERVDTLETNIQTDVLNVLNRNNSELFSGPTGAASQPQGIVALSRGTDVNASIGDEFNKVGTIRASKYIYEKFIEGDGFASELSPDTHTDDVAYARIMNIVNDTPIYSWINLDTRNYKVSSERFLITTQNKPVLSVDVSNNIVLGNVDDNLVINSKISGNVNISNSYQIDSVNVISQDDTLISFGNLDRTFNIISNDDEVKINSETIIHTGNVSDYALTDLGKSDIELEDDITIKYSNNKIISKDADMLFVGEDMNAVSIPRQSTLNVIDDAIIRHNDVPLFVYNNERYRMGRSDKSLHFISQQEITANVNGVPTSIWTSATHDVPNDGRSYVRKNGEWSNATLSDVDGSVQSDTINLVGITFSGFAKVDAISGVPAYGSATETNVQGAELVSINWNDATGESKFEVVLKGTIRPDGNFRLFKRDYVDGSGLTQSVIYDSRDAVKIVVGDTTRFQWDTKDLAEIPDVGESFDFVLTDAFDFSGGIDHAINDGYDYVSRDGSWKRFGEIDVNLVNDAVIKTNGQHTIGLVSDEIVLGNVNTNLVINSLIKTASFERIKNSRGDTVLHDNGTDVILSNVTFDVAPTVAGAAIWGDFNAPGVGNDTDYWAIKNGQWEKIFNGVDVDSDMIINSPNKYAYNVEGDIKRLAEFIGETHVLFDSSTKTQFKGKISELNLDVNTKIKHDNVDVIGVQNDDIVIGDTIVKPKINIQSDDVSIDGDKVLTQNDYEAPLDGGRYVRRNGEWMPAYYYGDEEDMPTNPVDGDLFFEFLN